MKPLWWIWLATFTRLLVWGCPYFAYRRGDVRGAWFVAGVVTRAVQSIRAST